MQQKLNIFRDLTMELTAISDQDILIVFKMKLCVIQLANFLIAAAGKGTKMYLKRYILICWINISVYNFLRLFFNLIDVTVFKLNWICLISRGVDYICSKVVREVIMITSTPVTTWTTEKELKLEGLYLWKFCNHFLLCKKIEYLGWYRPTALQHCTVKPRLFGLIRFSKQSFTWMRNTCFGCDFNATFVKSLICNVLVLHMFKELLL